MPRRVILFTGPFADLPLAELAPKASEWGYAGLELCCWGAHLEVQHALGDTDYSAARLSLLAGHDLQVPVISNHRVGQAVCDRIDERHQALLPDYVWGDGDALFDLFTRTRAIRRGIISQGQETAEPDFGRRR